MKVTKYFKRKSELTAYAKAFVKEHPTHWYLRTTLKCDHRTDQHRKAIVLVKNEQIIQRLILCNACCQGHSKN